MIHRDVHGTAEDQIWKVCPTFCPRIAVPLTHTINTEVVQLPYLRELPLAHPVDHYWDFVEDNIIGGNGPTAMSSKLGYLLSGPLPVAQSQNEITSTFHIYWNN